jgi:hypothetical protein
MSFSFKEKFFYGMCVNGHYKCKVYIDVHKTHLILCCPHCGSSLKFEEGKT